MMQKMTTDQSLRTTRSDVRNKATEVGYSKRGARPVLRRVERLFVYGLLYPSCTGLLRLTAVHAQGKVEVKRDKVNGSGRRV